MQVTAPLQPLATPCPPYRPPPLPIAPCHFKPPYRPPPRARAVRLARRARDAAAQPASRPASSSVPPPRWRSRLRRRRYTTRAGAGRRCHVKEASCWAAGEQERQQDLVGQQESSLGEAGLVAEAGHVGEGGPWRVPLRRDSRGAAIGGTAPIAATCGTQRPRPTPPVTHPSTPLTRPAARPPPTPSPVRAHGSPRPGRACVCGCSLAPASFFAGKE